jgi:chromosome partitioning related protein ParA
MATQILTFASTKGGVGKTTTAANIGGLLADLQARVLFVDADRQGSLSKFFRIKHQAAHGLKWVLEQGGQITPECISTTHAGVDVITTGVNELDHIEAFLTNRTDQNFLLKRAMRSPVVQDNYDIVIIDSEGARTKLQCCAILAGDRIVSPIKPDVISSSEFMTGTLRLIEDLNAASDFNVKVGVMSAFINATDKTKVALSVTQELREQLRQNPLVSVLNSSIPARAAFATAAANCTPVHRLDRAQSSSNTELSASDALHNLVWELFPNYHGFKFENGYLYDVNPQGEESQT